MTATKQRYTLRHHADHGPRHCEYCRTTKPRKGGREVTYAGGLKVRWMCADCGSRHAPMGNA